MHVTIRQAKACVMYLGVRQADWWDRQHAGSHAHTGFKPVNIWSAEQLEVFFLMSWRTGKFSQRVNAAKESSKYGFKQLTNLQAKSFVFMWLTSYKNSAFLTWMVFALINQYKCFFVLLLLIVTFTTFYSTTDSKHEHHHAVKEKWRQGMRQSTPKVYKTQFPTTDSSEI